MSNGDLYQSPLLYGTTFEESTADGIKPRPHWAPLLDALQTMGPEEIEARWTRAERRIRDNGITYNVYGDPLGANRPWKIDIVPLVIAAEEWRSIEAGVKQRAQLLNCLLEDLYGPQQLLKEGRFPAALLYANPAFLRPLAGVPVPAHSYLHMMAIDLARSPDGRWWVLADRTQAPSGSGYALENRLIVSDVLPELFRAANVQRLAPFFRAQRDTLLGLAGGIGPDGASVADPRVVLLTPGPHNETYFEHSYLAKYLDVTLVEGADLTVRDRAVYLKTVGGLEKVDVILRRVDDNFCDPLELRSDSLLGVAGLVDAVVAGNVRVANALGSGLIESASIMPFLPGLARHLLGQELLLPSVATWWCGQQSALDWVVDHLDRLVVKPAFPAQGSGAGMEPVFGSELSPAEREAFLTKLRSRPHEYVAQEQVALSTAPVWEGGAGDLGGLKSRSVVLRTYVLNTGKGWMVIPGGLVRVAEGHGGAGTGAGSVVSMQRGGGSKDAWVLSHDPVDTFSMLPARDEPVKLRRVSSVVPSRVADNTFWLGRYVERAENTARVLRSMVPRVRRADEAELGSLWRLHSCLGSPNSKLPKRKRPSFALLEKEMISLLSDRKRWDSLPATLSEVARTGGNVRERLSADMMLLINQLRSSMQMEPKAKLSDAAAKLTGGLELLSTFSGMERENLIRGSGWLFLSLGRRMERAITLTRALREITRPLAPENWAYMQWLLEVADSAMTYRQRYYTTLQPLPLLDVLLMDETNPRSLHFQMEHVVTLYRKLPRGEAEELQSMERALEALRGTDLQAMQFPAGVRAGGKDPFTQLDRFLGELTEQLFGWSNRLSSRYFSHARTLPSTMG